MLFFYHFHTVAVKFNYLSPRGVIRMEQIKNILARIVAVFMASGLSIVGAGTIAGIELWQAVAVAGIGGVATVVEKLSRAFLDDGKLSVAEINEAFNSVDKRAVKKK